MKARIKFRKYGALRFIGHLDVMRFFQKVMRRADIPIAFTGGFSPHMIMSFASPLGIGLESEGEYFDIELTRPIDSEEARGEENDRHDDPCRGGLSGQCQLRYHAGGMGGKLS